MALLPEYIEFVARSGESVIAKVSAIAKVSVTPNGSGVCIDGADCFTVSDETASELRKLLNPIPLVSSIAAQPSILQAS